VARRFSSKTWTGFGIEFHKKAGILTSDSADQSANCLEPQILRNNMSKITGLDQLTRELDEAKKALAAVDGELGAVNFNPHDPASIEAAVQEVERMIDERLGSYAANPIVAPIVEQMKESYRAEIIERAAAARLNKEQNE
jgi:hypothetical protein